MAATGTNVAGRIISTVFEYDTAKIVHINSKSVGIINRILQLAVLLYVLIWVFIIKKGYQKEVTGVSGTTSKVKGIAFPNISQHLMVADKLSMLKGSHKSGTGAWIPPRVWDTVDVTVPAEENNAFCVTTNVIITQNQTSSVCAESSDVWGAQCYSDDDCLPVGKPLLLGHGVTNGSCNIKTSTCFVKAWCPIENDDLTTNATYQRLLGVEDFTILIKNFVYFQFYKIRRHNILDNASEEFLENCTYEPDTSPFCPVFRISDILAIVNAKSGHSKTVEQEDIYLIGGVISIRISWDCNFDHTLESCKPKYEFDRLDNRNLNASKGYNYRYAHNYFDEYVTERRQLIKAFGILFIINVEAKAGKFNVVPTLLNLGSGLALLSVTTILCDLIILYLHKNKLLFYTHKYEQVVSDDSYNGYENMTIQDHPDSEPI